MKRKVSLVLTIVLLLLAQFTMAQSDNLSGKIVDENGNILPGTNIVIKGTANGTVANSDGEFKIRVPKGKLAVIVAFVGYKMLEAEVAIDANRSYQLDIVLIKDKKSNKDLKSSFKLTEPAKI